MSNGRFRCLLKEAARDLRDEQVAHNKLRRHNYRRQLPFHVFWWGIIPTKRAGGGAAIVGRYGVPQSVVRDRRARQKAKAYA